MIEVRTYGDEADVILVHGGPGAAGYLAPLAGELAKGRGVLEPLQRMSGEEPLTVARHVADLEEVIAAHGERPPIIVGHSWGAMLALAHASAHPSSVRRLVLVSCGTFDAASRAQLTATRDERMDEATRRRMIDIVRDISDADERFAAFGAVYEQLDSYDLLERDAEPARCDEQGYRESWGDMMRLEREGTHPAAFAAITCPVVMIHGDHDPHPGSLVRDSLSAVIEDLTYHELERCGHYPWRERHARERFLTLLREAVA